MEREMCDFYTASNRKTDKMCRYFKGNRDKPRQIDRCRHYCSILESKRMMEDTPTFKRVRGALRQI